MKTIIEKIWDSHVVEQREGFPDILAIDLHLLHEVTSPQAFQILRDRGLPVYQPEKVLATIDHNVSTIVGGVENPLSLKQIETLRENCHVFGIRLLDRGSGMQGIVHVIGPELGFTQPGMTIVCGDSHTSTHGAFGALAFGIGTSEVAQVLATGCILQRRPKSMRVHFQHKVEGVTAKDLILALIRKIGMNGGNGHIIEYTGLGSLSMEERMTICNMSIECGARAGLIAPDETTFQYLQERSRTQNLFSDAGAIFDRQVEVIQATPMVTWGTNPGQGIGIEETVPYPMSEGDQKALDYVKLSPGQLIEGVPVDYVFIGSCTNGRISDLRAAAEILKGRKVQAKVLVVPGSEAVRKQAIEEGLAAVFEEAGAEFRLPGCSMCLAMNDDRVPTGKRCASTSNRNFMGRQGPGSITHLMSPVMAAAAAITGKITDARRFK